MGIYSYSTYVYRYNTYNITNHCRETIGSKRSKASNKSPVKKIRETDEVDQL